jgi:hypothetical protein
MRGMSVPRVHDLLAVGTRVLDGGVLVVARLHVAHHVGSVRGAKAADIAQVLTADWILAY